MIRIILILTLHVISIDALGLIPNSFEYVNDLNISKNYSAEAFLVAGNATWSILATIPIDGMFFPGDLFTLDAGLAGFHVDVKLLEEDLLLTFESPNCQSKYEGMTKTPIKYRIFRKSDVSPFIHFKHEFECVSNSVGFGEGIALIGYVNDKTWYLLNRKKTVDGISVGLIIFGRNISDSYLKEVVEDAMNEISATFFNNTLEDRNGDLKLSNNDSECDLRYCYDPKEDLQLVADRKLEASREAMNQYKRDILLFVIMSIFVGIFLLGIVIFVVFVDVEPN